MNKGKSKKSASAARRKSNTIFEQLPSPVQDWAESLPWQQRSYLLLLCHLLCASPPEMQAEFLDDYTADGLVLKNLQDTDTQERVKKYLKEFSIKTELTEPVLRSYIKQFYIHSSQDVRRTPEFYLESALRLVSSTQERNDVFNYILGFELIKMLFQMSWLQHERLYQLQKNQEEFFLNYIKPIQHAHKLNGIVNRKNKEGFFDKRDYFVQQPQVSEKKLIELIMATFSTEAVTNLGFTVIRNLNALEFDHDYIFNSEQDSVFPKSF